MRLLADQAPEGATILLDRTVETLVAHVFALGVWDEAFCDECWDVITKCTATCPKPEVTIHLVASPTVVKVRAAGRERLPALLTEARFIDQFNGYFSAERRGDWPCTPVDAGAKAEEVAAACREAICR